MCVRCVVKLVSMGNVFRIGRVMCVVKGCLVCCYRKLVIVIG